MATTLAWTPITDIDEPMDRLEVAELRSLDALWREQRAELEDTDAMRRFRERLSRSWAIETGVIERVYSLDRGTTELLIEHGLEEDLVERASTDQEPARVVAIIRDQRAVIDGLFDFIARRRPLSVSYVRELHAALTRNQTHVDAIDSLGRTVEAPLLHGEYKRLPNNPRRSDGTVHEYCPPEQVASEMDRLVELHLAHEGAGVPPEVEAAFLHHRFTQIHPFQDGNGRVARALASLVLLRAGWFPFNVHRDRKAHYIETLEAADGGTLRDLARLIADVERREIVRALGLADEAADRERAEAGIDDIIAAARESAGAPTTRNPEELAAARETVGALFARGSTELERVAEKLRRDLTDYVPALSAWPERYPPEHERARWHAARIVGFARRDLHYFANLDTHASWMRLRLKDARTESCDDVIVAFHGVGQTFRGVMGVVAFIEHRSREESGWQTTGVELLDDDLFQINAYEPRHEAESRFAEWFGEILTRGLAVWQRRLPSG